MIDELDSAVPDDNVEKPDAIVIIEDKKPEGDKKDDVVLDAATEGVEALARNLEESRKREERERTQRHAAEAKATEAEGRVAEAQSKITVQQQQNIEANRTAANNAKIAAQSELEKAEADYIALQSEGKFKEAFEATRRGARAQQQLDQADSYLTNLEAEVERRKAEPPAVSKPVSDDKGTVDSVTGIKFTPKTFAWIKEQGDNWKDQDFRIACDAASRAAKRKGLVADTDEYTDFIDSHLVQMGFKEAAQTEEEDVSEPAPKPKVAVVKKPVSGASSSPPPSRAVAGSSGVAKKGIKLSGAEREMADSIVKSLPELFSGVNPDQLYAKEKAKIIEERGDNYGTNDSRQVWR